MNTLVIAILLTILVCSISSFPNGNQRTATNRNSPETVSQRKCKEFSEIQDEDTGPWTCSFQYWNFFPGSRAGPYEFPHLVLLGYQSDRKPDDIRWACTGNLISDQYVVTVAHCLVSRLGSPTYVRMGVSSVINDTQHRQEFNVEEVIVHPDYSNRYFYNDVGLVKLDKKAKLNSKVKPICLPSESVPDNKDIISAGFDLRGSLDSRTEKLINYTIKTLNVDVCNEAFKTNRRSTKRGLDNSQLCIGVSKEYDKLCNDVSGWPAQIYNDKVYCTYQLISMTAFGIKRCTSSEDPSVHTNVFPFVQWIESIVWPEDQINNDNDDTIHFPF